MDIDDIRLEAAGYVEELASCFTAPPGSTRATGNRNGVAVYTTRLFLLNNTAPIVTSCDAEGGLWSVIADFSLPAVLPPSYDGATVTILYTCSCSFVAKSQGTQRKRSRAQVPLVVVSPVAETQPLTGPYGSNRSDELAIRVVAGIALPRIMPGGAFRPPEWEQHSCPTEYIVRYEQTPILSVLLDSSVVTIGSTLVSQFNVLPGANIRLVRITCSCEQHEVAPVSRLQSGKQNSGAGTEGVDVEVHSQVVEQREWIASNAGIIGSSCASTTGKLEFTTTHRS